MRNSFQISIDCLSWFRQAFHSTFLLLLVSISKLFSLVFIVAFCPGFFDAPLCFIYETPHCITPPTFLPTSLLPSQSTFVAHSLAFFVLKNVSTSFCSRFLAGFCEAYCLTRFEIYNLLNSSASCLIIYLFHLCLLRCICPGCFWVTLFNFLYSFWILSGLIQGFLSGYFACLQ